MCLLLCSFLPLHAAYLYKRRGDRIVAMPRGFHVINGYSIQAEKRKALATLVRIEWGADTPAISQFDAQ
jgi:hypothetical protein